MFQSVCPCKKSMCILATKSWSQLTYISLIVGDPQGILDQQLRPSPVDVLNITIILISYKTYIFMLFNNWIIKKIVRTIPTKSREHTFCWTDMKSFVQLCWILWLLFPPLGYCSGTVFTTLHFHQNLWKGHINKSVCPWQAFSA